MYINVQVLLLGPCVSLHDVIRRSGGSRQDEGRGIYLIYDDLAVDIDSYQISRRSKKS